MSKSENKTRLAKKLNISRGMLYYQPKRPALDERVRVLILEILSAHPSYGHKRIALALKLNKKRILRIMKLYNLKPYRRRRTPFKPDDLGRPSTSCQNLIKDFCPIKANVVWVGDFTYLSFQGIWYYLATVMDLYTREILGWSLSNCHDLNLVQEAFDEALKHEGVSPLYFHCDQGSEYASESYLNLIKNLNITISMSRKSSPWENGFQESFYSNFKLDLGDLERFSNLGELMEGLSYQINYYNRERIHTKLKTSPTKFRQNHDVLVREYLYKELGT